MIVLADLKADMQSGAPGWETKVEKKDFDNNLPEIKKKGGKYHFKDQEFENYIKQKVSQGYIEEYF